MKTFLLGVLTSILLTLLLAQDCEAAPPPLEFKGFPLGGQLADFKKQFTENCSEWWTKVTTCRDFGRFDYGPADGKSYTAEFAADGKLGRVTVIFASDRYNDVADALTAKYGKPTRVQNGAVQNRFGAAFSDRTMVWDRPDGVIQADEHSGDLDTAAVVLVTRSFLKVQAEIDKEFARRNGKKL